MFRYPDPGIALGLKHEYTMKQMLWQASEAGFEIDSAEYYHDRFRSVSWPARIAWMLVSPSVLIPHIRNGLAIVMRRPAVAWQ